MKKLIISLNIIGLVLLSNTMIAQDNELLAFHSPNKNYESYSMESFGEFNWADPSSYGTVNLNGQTWLAKNLNVKVMESWCADNNPSNCSDYGRLYSWKAARLACQKLGPGWRLPTDSEWREMTEAFGGNVDKGGSSEAFRMLIDGGRGSFDAQLGGWRDSSGTFYSMGHDGFYWSSTTANSDVARGYSFNEPVNVVFRATGQKDWGFSCRCVKD